MAKTVTANGKTFTFDDDVTIEQIGTAVDEYFAGQVEPVKKKGELEASSEATSGEYLATPLQKASTSQSGKPVMGFSEIPREKIVEEAPKEVETPKSSVNKNKFEPTIADVNKKITEITLKQKYPEDGEFKSFAEASKQAISEEQKQAQLDAENRSKERRLKTIPAELQELREEKKELLLKKDYPSMKKLQALDAVERRYEKLLKENEPKSYADISNLNKDVIKGMEDEVHQYINLPENKYIKEKIALRGLTDIETNEILLAATEQKTKPIIADIKQLTNEGIVDIAKQRMEMSKSINAKQDELKNILLEIDKIEESELDKKGFKELNVQINKERGNLDKLKPLLAPIEGNAKLIAKERAQIETEIKQFDSKINGNQWLGTEQELKKYKQLFSDYNVLLSKEKEIENSPEFISYNKQIGVLNSLLETKKGLVKGLEGTKHPELVAKYDLIRNDINNIITKYQETDSPEINQKLNQFYTLTNQLDKATEKYEGARGRLVSLDELDRAKKEIENDPNYATDFGARALNSIADFGKGLAAFPFSFAASLHSDGGYHYSDAVSDLIQGKGMEKGFLINKNESLINPETGKANWGVIPIINSIGDNLGTLLGFATTGRYLTPIVAGEVAGASSTIMEAQKATEIAKAYTTIVPAYMSSYSGALDEAKELGFQGKGAFLYANAIGFLNGVSEMILPDQDLVFGKGVKTKMLKEFIENYAKNPTTAVKDLTTQFVKNGLGGASEEWIVMLGETAASSLGHLADSDIKAKIPTIDEIATTGVSSFVLEGGMGMIGQYAENKTLNRLGKLEFAKDFENGKLILDGLKERGAITDDKYNKLVSDIQKYQSVIGQVPDGISDFKKIAIIEKMLDIKAIKENLPKEKSEVFEKIANKKINEIQTQIEAIIDDKDFDKNEEKKFRSEIEKMVQMANESAKSRPAKGIELQRFTSPTEDNYGTINRNDGKGIVTLTKEEYLNEVESKISNLEKSIDNIDNEQSKAVVYEQVNELNKEKAEILKREIKQENEIRSTDNNIPQQVESPPQEIKLTPIEVIAGKEQGDGGVAKVVQGDGQGELALKTKEEIVAEVELKKQEAESKIKRRDLFDGVGEFSTELGGSDKAAVPISHKEKSGIEFVEYAHPETGSVDVIVTGKSDNDFVGFYRIYENGKPTNKWSSKFENQSRNKEDFKTMISGVQEMLPQGHEYTEKTSISTDGLRVWNQQLNRGYELQYDNKGNLITNRVAINGDAINNELGIAVNKGNFENVSVTNNADMKKVKEALLPYLQKFGLNESNIHFENGTVEIDLPVLKSNKVGSQENINAKVEQVEGQARKESAELRAEEEALDTRNAKEIGDIQINDINSGNVVIGYHATPTGEIGTGKELGIHIGTEDVSNNIKKGRNADKGDVKKVAFRVNKPLILGDMPSWSSVNVLNEMMRLKLLGIDKEKIREIRDSDLSEKEKQQRAIELAKENGYDSFAYQNFDEGNGEFSYVLFDDSKLNDITPKEAKATPQAGSVVGGNKKSFSDNLKSKGFDVKPNGVYEKNGVRFTVENDKVYEVDNGEPSKYFANKTENSAIIENIENINANKGEASKLLDEIIQVADEQGKELQLFVRAAKVGKLGNKQLTDWYKRKGFEQRADGVMVRKPKAVEQSLQTTPQAGSVVGASLRDVELKMRRPEKNEVIFVSVDALLQKHAADQPSYDVQKEGNRIKGRVEKAKEFIKNYIKDQRAINPKTGERMNTKVSFEPSVVDIDANGKISFEDGRHRVLAAKEMGLTEVPIEVPKERVKAVEQSLKETPQEVKVSTPEKVQEEADIDNKLAETEKAIDVYKRLLENNDTSTRKEYKALPESIKRVLDNIVNIHQQLEQKKIITKKGNCP